MKRGTTEQAKQLKAKAPPLVVEQFEKQYDHSMALFEKVDHSMAYDTALLFIKEVEQKSSEPISCRAGCGFCCHQPVYVSTTEFEAIKDHLVTHNIKVDLAKVQAQHDDISDGIYHKLKVPERRCVFLGDNSACTIYEARPLMCRRHVVYSDPQHCASGSTSQIKYDVSPRTEGHLSAYFAFYQGDHFQGHLLGAAESLRRGGEPTADETSSS
ncbi:MAG: YkgJ family cysteine cluster protein [Chitinophagaceae bacterium]|nr:YkgJ family cysteine cluster protein [Oligoflexus sp.]